MKDELWNDVSIRRDLDIQNFPIISIEISIKNQKNLVVTGVYRTWSKDQENELNKKK